MNALDRKAQEVKAKRQEYYQRPEVKAKIKEYTQRPEVKAKIKEYTQKPEVKAKRKKYFEEWCSKNKSYMIAYMKKYREEHPEYVEREKSRRRKPNGYIAKRIKQARQRKKKVEK